MKLICSQVTTFMKAVISAKIGTYFLRYYFCSIYISPWHSLSETMSFVASSKYKSVSIEYEAHDLEQIVPVHG